jgi:hypothetical protein
VPDVTFEAVRAVLLKIFWDVIPVDWYLVADVSIDRYVTLKMKALPCFDMSVTIYRSTRRNIPEDLNLQVSGGSYGNHID